MNGISSASALKSGVRVLVIDDNQDLAEVLVEFLAESGCEVRSAGDGASGLTLFRSFAPEALSFAICEPTSDDRTSYGSAATTFEPERPRPSFSHPPQSCCPTSKSI